MHDIFGIKWMRWYQIIAIVSVGVGVGVRVGMRVRVWVRACLRARVRAQHTLVPGSGRLRRSRHADGPGGILGGIVTLTIYLGPLMRIASPTGWVREATALVIQLILASGQTVHTLASCPRIITLWFKGEKNAVSVRFFIKIHEILSFHICGCWQI